METWLSYDLQDFILFSPDVYFGLFRQANEAFWPVALAAQFAGLFILWAVHRRRGFRVGAMLLGLLWIGVIIFFLRPYYLPVNWAVDYAIYAFAAEALLLSIIAAMTPAAIKRSSIGIALLAAALAYPLLAPLSGRSLIEAEVFGLAPDPTAIFTLGFLLQIRDWRTWLILPIPLLWCAFSALTLYGLEQNVAAFAPALATIATVLAMIFPKKFSS